MAPRNPEEVGGGAAYDASAVEGQLGSTDATPDDVSQAKRASVDARVGGMLADEHVLLTRVESSSSAPEVDATRTSGLVISLTLSRNS